MNVKLAELEVYSEASNFAVIKPPGRHFPGSVIQGDTLYGLSSTAKELSERILQLGIQDEELLYLAQGLQEELLERLLHYQRVVSEHGLPYPWPASASDLVRLVPRGDDAP